MKISEIITDKYKLRIPPTVYYELLADVVEVEEDQESCGDAISRQAVLDTIGNVPDYDDGMVWEALSHAQRDVALLPPVNQQEPKTGYESKLKHSKNFDVLHFVADNAGLSTFEAIEKAYIIGVSEQEPILDKIRAEIEQTTSRYTISRERDAMGQVEWSDRLIKESEISEILDKYKAESEDAVTCR